MKGAARGAAIALAVVACFATPSALPQASVRAWLDRYAAGDYTAVAAELDAHRDFQQLLDDLNAAAPAFLAAGGPADVDRRTLAAATFALEAARVASWLEWKIILAPPTAPDNKPISPLPTLYWRPAPLLIEWGCSRLRAWPTPGRLEHDWHLAAMAVALRAEDPQFLIGVTKLIDADAPPPPKTPWWRQPRNGDWGRLQEVLNKQDEINHVAHVLARFPQERRFTLADAIARDQVLPDEALIGYQSLVDDVDVAGEAFMRIGALQLRRNRVSDALKAFEHAEQATRDPYVIYLVRLYRAQIFVGQKRATQAIEQLRGAVAARPGAQSASVMLAELLMREGWRSEAQELMAAALAAPAGGDPYLEHMHGDDRFWPELLSRVQREIRK